MALVAVAQVHVETGGAWSEAFTVAHRDGHCFEQADIAETLAVSDGEYDEYDWLWIGKLKDGRYAFMAAGADYTGWG